MELFLPTLNQMGYLFALIVIGYILMKLRVVSDNAAGVLSKLENNLFIPALVMGTFMTKFTMDNIRSLGQFLLAGVITIAITAPLAVLLSKGCSKDRYVQKICTYGLAFSNFGFMGNAVVKGLFGDEFLLVYLIFTLPFWALIYTWGVPALLIPAGEGKRTVWQRIKPFVNPMFIGMIVGVILGLFPFSGHEYTDFGFFGSLVRDLGNCMSPIAMVLTGMTIAKIDIGQTMRNLPIYVTSALRLVVIPLVAIGIFALALHLFPTLSKEVVLCTICALAMPLGLSTIVVPAGYGMDTTVASGMALVSHLLSCITIPLVFLLAQSIGILPVL
ncbi:MAG: hypothetical protein E7585_07235 [Ruminococcaceae bacterium]|nr:hypothetical protein [Oscillospiraceae bacterium]